MRQSDAILPPLVRARLRLADIEDKLRVCRELWPDDQAELDLLEGLRKTALGRLNSELHRRERARDDALDA